MPHGFDLTTAREVDNGAGGFWLDVDGTISVPGVAEYREGARTVREYTSPEVLQDPTWLAAISRSPVTLDHPPRLLSGDELKRYQVGQMGNVVWVEPGFELPSGEVLERGGNRTTFRFTDPKAISAVRSGKIGLSPGYRADTADEAGTSPWGEDYDRYQRRRYAANHSSSCDEPRYDSCRLDSLGTEDQTMTMEECIAMLKAATPEQIKELVEILKKGTETAAEEPGSDPATAGAETGELAALREQLDGFSKRMDELAAADKPKDPPAGEDRMDSAEGLRLLKAASGAGVPEEKIKAAKTAKDLQTLIIEASSARFDSRGTSPAEQQMRETYGGRAGGDSTTAPKVVRQGLLAQAGVPENRR